MTQPSPAARPSGGQVIASVLVFLSLAGVVCGLTLLFLGMRSVMEVGGVCADGGPYVSRQSCPEGTPLAVLGGLFGGVAALLVYLYQTFKNGIPGFVAFAWPALFLSLGWNFLEFGVDPPGPSNVEVGWLICAVVFGIMGAAPLLIAPRDIIRGVLPFGHGSPPAQYQGQRVTSPSFFRRSAVGIPETRREPTKPTSPPPQPEGAPGETAIDALERLAALRDSGALTEDEFEEMKQRVLRGRE